MPIFWGFCTLGNKVLGRFSPNWQLRGPISRETNEPPFPSLEGQFFFRGDFFLCFDNLVEKGKTREGWKIQSWGNTIIQVKRFCLRSVINRLHGPFCLYTRVMNWTGWRGQVKRFIWPVDNLTPRPRGMTRKIAAVAAVGLIQCIPVIVLSDIVPNRI